VLTANLPGNTTIFIAEPPDVVLPLYLSRASRLERLLCSWFQVNRCRGHSNWAVVTMGCWQRALDRDVAQGTSQLKAADEQSKNSEEHSRLIVDNIPGLIALLSATGEIEVVNRQLFDYFGQTLEELKQWGTNDTVHPEDLPNVIDVFSRSIAIGSSYETVQRFKRSDGVYRWFQNRGFPVRDTNGTVNRWCVLLTDIDDRMRAEEAFRESEHESRLILPVDAFHLAARRHDGDQAGNAVHDARAETSRARRRMAE
jgi:PAS domain S-box-containing protein